MKDELFICKVKECGLDFFSEIIFAMNEYIKEHYPDYIGRIRNAPDGTYELYAVKKDSIEQTV